MTLQADAVTDGAATVEALSRALELHDYRRGEFGETAAHTERVTRLALALAEQVAPELLLDPQLAFGFRLHDIGMIGIPSSTLIKPGPLSPDRGRRDPRAPVARRAHRRSRAGAERRRARGDRLPSRALGRQRLSARACAATRFRSPARIFAIVDAFDAITHDQPYREALGVQAAREEIHAKAGTRLRPRARAGLPHARRGGRAGRARVPARAAVELQSRPTWGCARAAKGNGL